MDTSESFTPRRGSRVKKPSIRYLETFSSKEVEELCSSDSDNNKKKQKVRKTTYLESNDSEDDPFADSGSDFEEECSSVNSESPSDASTCSKSSSKSYEFEDKPKLPSINNKFNNPTSRRRLNQKYTINTDDYFSSHGSKKIVTSDNTLEKLETPRLTQDILQELLKNMTLSKSHENCMASLLYQNRSMFDKWLCLLRENFNVLLYGLGSKRDILRQFQDEYLRNDPVVVINGFFPNLSVKDILDGILIDIFESKKSIANVYEACKLIEENLLKYPELHVYLIVHNIDGTMLRNSKAQNVLAQLASNPKIHLLASIDHINGPLIWDHPKLNQFNYTWWDMTSFLPYIDETSFESSVMIKKKGELALASLRNVYLSLTTNGKGIYILIIKHQLENASNPNYEGFSLKDLYSSCREDFLVSSDLALKAQLTEFLDHKILKFKRSLNGIEYVVIPLPNSLLQKFLDEQS